jgi:hypothetical protein
MAKHLLIAAATSEYPNLAPIDARPQLVGVLDSIVKLFTDRIGGYRRELETIRPRASSCAQPARHRRYVLRR